MARKDFASAEATRAAPVNFWMLNFAEIQHQVASKTLENTTTFTRHHAFLKKAGENFPSITVVRVGDFFAIFQLFSKFV